MPDRLTEPDPTALRTLTGSVDPVVVVGSDLQVLGVSGAFLALSGWTAAQLVGQPLTQLCMPHDREALQTGAHLFLHQGALPDRRDFTLRGADHAPLPVQLRGVRYDLPGAGRIAALLVRPVTPLRPVTQFYRQVLHELPLGVSVTDTAGRYVYANPATLPLRGEREALIGRTDREAADLLNLPGDTLRLREEALTQMRREPARLAWDERLAGGAVQERSLIPIHDANGELSLLLSYATDLPERARQSERLTLLEGSMQASTSPVCILDARRGAQHGRVAYANAAMGALHASTQVLGTHPLEWPWLPLDRQSIRALLTHLNDTPQQAFKYDLHLPGRREWWEVSATRVGRAAAPGSHWALILRDVREERHADLFLRSFADATVTSLQDAPLEDVLAPIFRGVQQVARGWSPGVATLDSEFMRVMGPVPAPLERMLSRYPTREARALWSGRDLERQGTAQVIHDLWDQLRVGEQVGDRWIPAVQTSVEVPMYDRDRQLLGLLALTHPNRMDVPQGVQRLAENVASQIALFIDRQRKLEQLQRLAYTDTLTGLQNRAGFTRAAGALLDTPGAAGSLLAGSPLAVALMDLNRFKLVNDTLGHDVGDQLLAAISERLAEVTARYPAPVLARMGGDEFAVILSDPAQIDALSGDIHDAVTRPFVIGGRQLRVGIAIGWSVYPDTAQDSAALLRQADTAMYHAKRAGQSHQVFSPSAQPCISHLTLETALFEALQEEQFSLVFQPQVSCADGQLCGAEVLLRWTHPELGAVSPADFIPVAESTGLIGGIGLFVLRAALREVATWPAQVPVSVNVSPVQLRQPGFAQQVAAMLREAGVAPHRLTLEVTETAFINDLNAVTEAVRRLRALGIRVAIDDFGTGYSTLMTLRQLLVHELKIDRAFVRDLNSGGREGRENRAIVQATLGLGQALGLNVVAEGVETQAQADALLELGCPVMQGWLIAPGLSAAAFRERFLPGMGGPGVSGPGVGTAGAES
ncbi:EAL domain-containing protein [Deinococcus knuensis]|uniref:Bifunctional diguanylate cyclase/phosphodiesterase n=1 Tax=Deinococcus knuensis TaxID=1837380 RepID=A0ABQ2SE77_9DEIO|nr:EAL domain-containing protein [Deinococcus knuensis]GGS22767.1 bifunctional diguanylate cyclase/phosphodiesterase [Deinococcus knuensis]